MQNYFLAISLILVTGLSNAIRARKSADVVGNNVIMQYDTMDGEADSNDSFWFDPEETRDMVTKFLKKNLEGVAKSAEMVVIDGSDLKPGGKVKIDDTISLDGEVLRKQAVGLLSSQNAISGLPDGDEKLHVGLMKASRVVLVLTRDADDRWNVKAVSAMKNTETVGTTTWCEAGYIVVDPSLQGRKIGSTLWRLLRVVAKEMKVEAFFTETVLSNVASLKLQRHNCVEVLTVGLFTERSACSQFPKRADLQLLVMLFPLVSTPDTQLRLHGIIAAIRGMYIDMRNEGKIEAWIENRDVGRDAHPEFLSYSQVLKAVREDPTLEVINSCDANMSCVDEWKRDYANSISLELGVAVPNAKASIFPSWSKTPSMGHIAPKNTAVATSHLQIGGRGLLQPTPMNESNSKIWNNKVIVISLALLILMNCAFLISAAYFRLYPRQATDEKAMEAAGMKEGDPEATTKEGNSEATAKA